MAFTGICVIFAILLCICSCIWAAPSVDDLSTFGELERTLKELAASVIAMSGAGANVDSDVTDGVFGDMDIDMLASEAVASLVDLNELKA